MSSIASCGHEIKDGDDEIVLSLKTTEISYSEDKVVAAVSIGVYCRACANKYERDGWVLHNEAEENAYLKSDKSEWRTL